MLSYRGGSVQHEVCDRRLRRREGRPKTVPAHSATKAPNEELEHLTRHLTRQKELQALEQPRELLLGTHLLCRNGIHRLHALDVVILLLRLRVGEVVFRIWVKKSK
jgi:hypothetical protein